MLTQTEIRSVSSGIANRWPIEETLHKPQLRYPRKNTAMRCHGSLPQSPWSPPTVRTASPASPARRYVSEFIHPRFQQVRFERSSRRTKHPRRSPNALSSATEGPAGGWGYAANAVLAIEK
jgi:hypothetical protein